MKRVPYRLPDSMEKVVAFSLWDGPDGSLLMVPPIEKDRTATLVMAHHEVMDDVFEDSAASSLPLNDYALIMILAGLIYAIKNDLTIRPTTFEE